MDGCKDLLSNLNSDIPIFCFGGDPQHHAEVLALVLRVVVEAQGGLGVEGEGTVAGSQGK